MPEPIYVLINFVLIFIQILGLAMSIRAILSWFFEGGGKFIQFLYVLTEPVILPFRKLFYKMNWFQETPMDVSFMFAYFALFIIELILGAFLA